MKLYVLVLCVIITNSIIGTASANECGLAKDQNVMLFDDEVTILKKTFNQLVDKLGTAQSNARSLEHNNNTEIALNDSSIFDIRFDNFPEKCKTTTLPRSCAEATACTQRSGIYKILLEKYNCEPFLVECDVKTEGGGWTLIQRRQDGSVDFFRNWDEYQKGFGNIEGEFFIGLDKLHALTNYNGPQELLVVLERDGEIKHAKYNNFVVGSGNESYPLKHLGVYSGDAGDSLTPHLSMKFSTKDVDNDIVVPSNCAEKFTGAWWYTNCHHSNLNGKYGESRANGIVWNLFGGIDKSVQHVKMMIRRRTF